MKEIRGVRVWGDPDERTLAQATRCAGHPAAVQVCIMADAHVGYGVPIGGVVAYRDAVSPSAVGFDIACGIKAVRTDARLEDVRAHLPRILDDVARTVAFGLGRSSPEPVEHPVLEDPAWTDVPEIAGFRQKAAAQLGTVGSGNHFVDLLADEDGGLWVAAHFGSRGLGFGICGGFRNLAAGWPFDVNPPREDMDARSFDPVTSLDPLGQNPSRRRPSTTADDLRRGIAPRGRGQTVARRAFRAAFATRRCRRGWGCPPAAARAASFSVNCLGHRRLL